MALDLNIISESLAKLVGFTLILGLSFVIGRVAGKFIERILHELELDKTLRRRGKRWNSESIIGFGIRYASYITGIVLALNYIGIYYAVSRFFAAIISVIITALLLLNLKDFIPNIYCGFTRKLRKSTSIEFDGVKGQIVSAGLTGYKIKTADNDTIILPYAEARRLKFNS